MLDLCKASPKTFTDLGCEVGEAVLDFDPAELWETWLTPRAWIIGTCLGHDYAEPALRPLMKDPAR